MLGKIKKLINRSVEEPRFAVEPHQYGVRFVCDSLEECRSGGAPEILQMQYIALRMLVEQGVASEMHDGFELLSEDVVGLDEPDRLLLGLPKPWHGEFRVDFKGVSTHPSFEIQAELVLPSGERVKRFTSRGPFLSLSEKEVFLPDSAQWLLLKAVQDHQDLGDGERTEDANLLAVKKLQMAGVLGVAADLSHFADLDVETPDGISFSAFQRDDGSLELLPSFRKSTKDHTEISESLEEGTESIEITTPEDVSQRLGYLEHGKAVFRVRNKFIVLDEERMEGVQEILTNRVIPPEQVRTFLESPGAFLDASKVDFDLGFSFRVKGATVFEPAYFGETDGSETDWTGCSGLSNPPAIHIVDLPSIAKTLEEVERIIGLIKAAEKAKKDSIYFGGQEIILGSSEENEQAVQQAQEQIKKKGEKEGEGGPAGETDPNEEKSRATVDIIPQDEKHELETTLNPQKKYHYPEPLGLSNCLRTPYSYQEEGIRWLLGLATNNAEMNWTTDFVGGVLADDMGLGKTFMSIVAAAEYARIQESRGEKPKPVLVVAPLSLLHNWRAEVELAYDPIPFDDVVLLQGKEDLPRFKARSGNETLQRDKDIEEGINALRYVLKIGASWGSDRLDSPNRLVLTTYQTLRDYQFSLCRIDWGFVILDEAQNIKNPNALQTRAAKGLKANIMVPATGTPVENSLTDFWCLFDTACPGFLENYQAFIKRYVAPIRQAEPAKANEVRSRVGKELRDSVGGLMLRRTKEDELDGIPSKHIHVYEKEMEGDQRRWYEAILGSMNVRSDDEPRGPAVLKTLHSLRDASLHPALLNGGQPIPPNDISSAKEHFGQSGKLTLLLEILDGIQAKKEKVIIFAVRRRFQAYLSMALGHIYGIDVEVVNGTTKTTSTRDSSKTRIGIIKRFEAKSGFNILIMSPIAAGVGLTIVGANHVVHLERHWNPAKEAQATDRVYRIGQEKDVHVHIPLLTHPEIDSFDVHLDRLLSRKLDLKDAVVTPTEASPNDFVEQGVFGGAGPKHGESTITLADLEGDLHWQTFEAIAALALAGEYNGEALLTKAPNDWGADAIVVSDKKVVLIQSKHHPGGKLASEKAVREVYGAKPKYEKLLGRSVDELVVATSARSAVKGVREEAKLCGVQLMLAQDLCRMLENKQVTFDQVYNLLNSKRFAD
jgi:SNF2 family DNA or RNA helicase